uniref:Uncharacterized protein n=1 Tax=Arundo donax TaxID=35708 RepID=A0A0A8Z073_ARUDO
MHNNVNPFSYSSLHGCHNG